MKRSSGTRHSKKWFAHWRQSSGKEGAGAGITGNEGPGKKISPVASLSKKKVRGFRRRSANLSIGVGFERNEEVREEEGQERREGFEEVDIGGVLETVKEEEEDWVKEDELRLREVERSGRNLTGSFVGKKAIGISADLDEAEDWGADFGFDDDGSGDAFILGNVGVVDKDQEGDFIEEYLLDTVIESFDESEARELKDVMEKETGLSIPENSFRVPLDYKKSIEYGYFPGCANPVILKLLDFLQRHDDIVDIVDDIYDDEALLGVLESAYSKMYSGLVDEDTSNMNDNIEFIEHTLEWKIEYYKRRGDSLGLSKCWTMLARARRTHGDMASSFDALQQALANYNQGQREDHNLERTDHDRLHWTSHKVELNVECGRTSHESGFSKEAQWHFQVASNLAANMATFKTGDIVSCERRSAWWTMYAKTLLASAHFASRSYVSAARFFAEYVLECMARIKGLTSLKSDGLDDGDDGILRFYLLSPQRLCLSLLCLGLCLSTIGALDHALQIFRVIKPLTLRIKEINFADMLSGLCSRLCDAHHRYCILRSRSVGEASKSDNIDDVIGTTAEVVEVWSGSDHLSDKVDDGENWDDEIARDLCIVIERCDADTPLREEDSDVESLKLKGDGPTPDVLGHSMPIKEGLGVKHADFKEGAIATSLLGSYLNELHSDAPGQAMYPRPTEPLTVPAVGPRELNHLLETYISNRKAAYSARGRIPGFEFAKSLQSATEVSVEWALLLKKNMWDLIKNGQNAEKEEARCALLSSLEVASSLLMVTATPSRKELNLRNSVFTILLEAVKMIRDATTQDCADLSWMEEAFKFMYKIAGSSRASHVSLKLLELESRAHFGVNMNCSWYSDDEETDIAEGIIRKCTVLQSLETLHNETATLQKESDFWLSMYANVSATLFLVGSGVSPVNGRNIDLKVADNVGICSDTSRSGLGVTSTQLIKALKDVYEALPKFTYAKAKVGLALGYDYELRASLKDLILAERYFFDAFITLHKHDLLRISQGTAIQDEQMCSSLAEAILRRYGHVLLRNSKYHYGVRALEAAMEAERAREPRSNMILSDARDIIDAARSKNDWFRALKVLDSLRESLHPKDNRRNEFAHLCLTLYQICHDAGCFDAAEIPLQAYTALIDEEQINKYQAKFEQKSQKGLFNGVKLVFPGEKNRFNESMTSHASPSSPRAKSFLLVPHSSNEEYVMGMYIRKKHLDAERFQLEYLQARLAFDKGAFEDAESRCRFLLARASPHMTRHKVYEIMAKIRLERREITNCLELIDKMESVYERFRKESERIGENIRRSRFATRYSESIDRDSAGEKRSRRKSFYAEAVFLRLSALRHGGRFAECLVHAEMALSFCPEESLHTRAKLHEHRGKALLQMCSLAAPPYPHERVVDLALTAFETSSSYHEIAGNELGLMRADLLWARTAVESVFRQVVLPRSCGGGVPLEAACKLEGRTIDFVEVENFVQSAMQFFSSINMPMLLIDAIVTFAEVKAIQGMEFGRWILEAWRLFLKLFVDSDNFRLVIEKIAPVGKLIYFKDISERLVRLVMCSEAKPNDRTTINRDLRIFEVFVSLEASIDRRMNLKSMSGSSSSRFMSIFSKGAGIASRRNGDIGRNNFDVDHEAHPFSGDQASRQGSDGESEKQSGTQIDIYHEALRKLGTKGEKKLARLRKKTSSSGKEKSATKASTSTDARSSGDSDSTSVACGSQEYGHRAMTLLGPLIGESGNKISRLSSRSTSMSEEEPHYEDMVPTVTAIMEEDDVEHTKSWSALRALMVSQSGEPPNLTVAERGWMYMHRKVRDSERYERGEIDLTELAERNGKTLHQWLAVIPRSAKEWTVPASIWKGLFYILYAGGVIGYYSCLTGGTISTVCFGGKQNGYSAGTKKGPSEMVDTVSNRKQKLSSTRNPSDAERTYLYSLIKDWRPADVWHKKRESEIVASLQKDVLKPPKRLANQLQRSGPLFIITNNAVQLIPWELFFDHVCVRSLCLLDVIRRLQPEMCLRNSKRLSRPLVQQRSASGPTPILEAIPIGGTRSRNGIHYVAFVASGREAQLLKSEAASRTQKLAFSSLVRLNHLNPSDLISSLELGGFRDPTSVNAGVRPTGPLSSALYISKRKHSALAILGLQLLRLGRAYPHITFIPVPALASATTEELVGQLHRTLGLQSRIAVFLFSLADLVAGSESVFGLLKTIPYSVLIFSPASKMRVLAHHLEDQELSEMLTGDQSEVPRVVLGYVSRFAREKLIPIVCFVGEGLTGAISGKRLARVRG